MYDDWEYVAKWGSENERADAMAALGLWRLTRDMLLVFFVFCGSSCGPIDPEPREPDESNQCDPGYTLDCEDYTKRVGCMCEPIGQ